MILMGLVLWVLLAVVVAHVRLVKSFGFLVFFWNMKESVSIASIVSIAEMLSQFPQE